MCSCRTYVPVIACLSIPGLELKAALLRTPTLALRPAALAPEPQGEPLIGPGTAAAEAAGVRPGMRLGEALATCPSLVLVEPDAAGAERAWEEIVRSLEDAGFSVETALLGGAYFETRRVARPAGASLRAPAHPSLVRGRRASSPTRSCRSSARRCRSRSCRSSAAVTRSSKRSEFGSWDSLPGFREAPSPNVWGRTAGAPGAWREAGWPRGCAAVARPPLSPPRSSSRKL